MLLLLISLESLNEYQTLIGFSVAVSLNHLKYALADNFAAVLTARTSKVQIEERPF